jgi:hypothetical protein
MVVKTAMMVQFAALPGTARPIPNRQYQQLFLTQDPLPDTMVWLTRCIASEPLAAWYSQPLRLDGNADASPSMADAYLVTMRIKQFAFSNLRI